MQQCSTCRIQKSNLQVCKKRIKNETLASTTCNKTKDINLSFITWSHFTFPVCVLFKSVRQDNREWPNFPPLVKYKPCQRGWCTRMQTWQRMQTRQIDAKFEAVMAVLRNMHIFWGVTTCHWARCTPHILKGHSAFGTHPVTLHHTLGRPEPLKWWTFYYSLVSL